MVKKGKISDSVVAVNEDLRCIGKTKKKQLNSNKMAVKKDKPEQTDHVNSLTKKNGKIKKAKLRKGLKRLGKKKQKRGLVKGESLREDVINQLLMNDSTAVEKPVSANLNGFNVIQWKFSSGSMATHQLFFKRHEVSIKDLTRDKPPGRTILCHNVPPYFSNVHLEEIFETFGTVEKVYLHQKATAGVPDPRDFLFPTEKSTIRGFKVGYVVFESIEAVNETLKLSVDDVEPVIVRKPVNAGFSRWINVYNSRVVETEKLEKSVRKFMSNFDKDEVRRKEMEKLANQPDDDGWVTVTRTGRKSTSGLVRSETMEQRLREKKKKQEKQLMNINPAQMKESKMKQLTELKKKFEEDKKRVQLLKQQRKFKPF